MHSPMFTSSSVSASPMHSNWNSCRDCENFWTATERSAGQREPESEESRTEPVEAHTPQSRTPGQDYKQTTAKLLSSKTTIVVHYMINMLAHFQTAVEPPWMTNYQKKTYWMQKIKAPVCSFQHKDSAFASC